MKEELVYMGVDIAKAYLDAAMGNEKCRFANDALGHRQLVNWELNKCQHQFRWISNPAVATKSVGSGACSCADQSQFGPSQPGSAICAGGGNLG